MLTCPSKSIGAYATHGAARGKYALELYDRPSASPELKHRMLRAEVLETTMYDCVTWSSRAGHYDTLSRAHRSFPYSRHWLAKAQSRRPPISCLGTLLMKSGSESIEATLRRRPILFEGFVARTENARLPKCMMLGELVGARATRGAGQ